MDLKELLVRAGAMPAQSPKRRKAPAHQKNGTGKSRSISIVIPAHNEEAYLKQTLLALRRQKYRNCEVIVVANGCTDGTADVARGLCDQLVVLSQKNLGVARNLGARIAKGELLVFLDADTLLEKHALQIIAEQFSARYAAATVKGKPDSDRLAYRVIYFVKNLIHQSSIHHGSSGVIVCRREHFIRLGGFNERLEVRENSELIRRLEHFGRYIYIGQAAAVTSMRRYERRGVWPMIWMWIKVWFESLFRDLQNRSYETVR